MADDEFFEEDDELPEEEPEAAERRRRLAAERPAPRGNTPRVLARDARRQALREATGQAPQEIDEWRQALRDGRRTRADALLRSKSPTKNAGSGFGAANPGREVP